MAKMHLVCVHAAFRYPLVRNELRETKCLGNRIIEWRGKPGTIPKVLRPRIHKREAQNAG